MLATMDIALSALNAFSIGQAVTANNIANANTNEFDPSRVVYEDRVGGGVAVSDIQKVDVQGGLMQVIVPEEAADGTMVQTMQYQESSGTDLATEMVNMMVTERAFEANATVVRTQDEMVGNLLDELV